MNRYAAFLRGVSPMNAKMPDLQRAFEAAGFHDVKTVLSSGNVVFTAPASAVAALEHKAELAMKKHLGVTFLSFVRPVETLRALLLSNPYDSFDIEPGAKRIVTFLREKSRNTPRLPIEVDGARILIVKGTEAFGAYVRSPRGPVFMTLIEKTFGKDVTTRTWDTLAKVSR